MSLREVSAYVKNHYRLAALIAALAGTAVPLHAEASCRDRGCDYKDSGTQGCRDGSQFTAASAAIKTSSGAVWGHVSLVYSPTCGAAWAYVASSIGSVDSITAQIQRQIGGGEILSPYAECFGCTSKRSVMMGDAASDEHAKATGLIKVHIAPFNFYPEFQASTSWF